MIFLNNTEINEILHRFLKWDWNPDQQNYLLNGTIVFRGQVNPNSDLPLSIINNLIESIGNYAPVQIEFNTHRYADVSHLCRIHLGRDIVGVGLHIGESVLYCASNLNKILKERK